jgi:hypothetical protein
VDNQHKLISGYRDLTKTEIEFMNEGKQLEAEVLAFIRRIEDRLNTQRDAGNEDKTAAHKLEQIRMHEAQPFRWLAIGKTDIQTGFMAVIRAIAQPQPTSPKPQA